MIKTTSVSIILLYNSIPQKENMFWENMFREIRKYVSRKMHPPQTNPRPINIEIEYSCELSHANADSMGVPWKREKWKIEKIQCPGFERGTGLSLHGPAPYPLGHRELEILYGLEVGKLCTDSAQQRIIRSWNWSCCGVQSHAAWKGTPYRSRIVLAHASEWRPWATITDRQTQTVIRQFRTQESWLRHHPTPVNPSNLLATQGCVN